MSFFRRTWPYGLIFLLNCTSAGANTPWRLPYFSPDSGCESTLSRPTPVGLTSPRAVRLDSGPVRDQCLGTCQFEAITSLIQAREGLTISSDYLNLTRLRRHVDFLLTRIAAGYAHGITYKNGLPDLLQASTNDFNDALNSMRSAQGIVFERDYKFPATLAAELKSRWQDDVGLVHPRQRNVLLRPGLEQLAVRVAVLLDRIVKGDPKSDDLKSEIRALIERAARGLRPGTKPEVTTRMFLPNARHLNQFVLRERFLEEVAEIKFRQALRLITETHDRGDNLLLRLWIDPEMRRLDGIMRLNGSVDEERARVSPKGLALYHHAVVIDGYERDARGRIVWLLLKDSWGKGRFDRGYVHLHVDAFRAFAGSLFTLGPE